MSEGANGYDVRIRALVSVHETESGTPALQKTIFDFKHMPSDPTVASHVIQEPDDRSGKTRFAYRLDPDETVHAGIGFIVEMPFPLCYLIFQKTGLMTKQKIVITNAPSIVDSDFRGEATLAIRNAGEKPFMLHHRIRIAQIKFEWAIIPNLIPQSRFEDLSSTSRGDKGLGSTGLL